MKTLGQIECEVFDFAQRVIKENEADADIRWRVARALIGTVRTMIAAQAGSQGDLEIGIELHSRMLDDACRHFYGKALDRGQKATLQ